MALAAVLSLAAPVRPSGAQDPGEELVGPVENPEAGPGAQAGETAQAEALRRTRLVGKAFLGRNRDVVGATVVTRPEFDPSRVYLTSSDNGGAFWVGQLPDGAYTIRLLRPGLLPVVKEHVSLRFPFRAVVEVRMEPDPAGPGGSVDEGAPDGAPTGTAVRVLGAVRERGGAAVAETRIRLLDPTGDADPVMAETDEGGSFRFEGVPSGRWSVEVLGVGYVPIRATVDLVTDTALDVGLVKQPTGYRPSPLDLMPLEHPIAPASLRF